MGEDLQAQVQTLQSQVQKSIRLIPGTPDEVQKLLRKLSLPPEYDTILSNEGIEFLDDLTNYTESDLVELGCKRGHVRRLLKSIPGNGSAEVEGQQNDVSIP